MENRGKSIFILMNWFLPKFWFSNCLYTVWICFSWSWEIQEWILSIFC